MCLLGCRIRICMYIYVYLHTQACTRKLLQVYTRKSLLANASNFIHSHPLHHVGYVHIALVCLLLPVKRLSSFSGGGEVHVDNMGIDLGLLGSQKVCGLARRGQTY